MSEHSPQTYSARQAELDAAREAFLQSGGTIKVLASFEYKAPPLKIDAGKEPPPPKQKKPRKVSPVQAEQLSLDKKARLELIERVRQKAGSMTQSEASVHFGISRKRLVHIAKQGGFAFVVRETKNLLDTRPSPEKDALLAARIKDLKEKGLSRRQVMGQLALGLPALNRILEAHGIDFPKLRRGERPAGPKAAL